MPPKRKRQRAPPLPLASSAPAPALPIASSSAEEEEEQEQVETSTSTPKQAKSTKSTTKKSSIKQPATKKHKPNNQSSSNNDDDETDTIEYHYIDPNINHDDIMSVLFPPEKTEDDEKVTTKKHKRKSTGSHKKKTKNDTKVITLTSQMKSILDPSQWLTLQSMSIKTLRTHLLTCQLAELRWLLHTCLGYASSATNNKTDCIDLFISIIKDGLPPLCPTCLDRNPQIITRLIYQKKYAMGKTDHNGHIYHQHDWVVDAYGNHGIMDRRTKYYCKTGFNRPDPEHGSNPEYGGGWRWIRCSFYSKSLLPHQPWTPQQLLDTG